MPALILMYHDLCEDISSVPSGHQPYVLSPATFDLQMNAAKNSGLVSLTVSEWANSSNPLQAIVLTFDDGHISNYETALPILQKHGLKATFFITAGMIGKNSTMTWEQLHHLQAAGMEIGSHTVTHRPPSTLNDDELRYELVESRRILEEGLGVPVTTISSPTGFFNPRMCHIAREVGYQSLCFGQFGLAIDQGNPFALKRVAVKRSLNSDEFNSLLRLDSTLILYFRLQQWGRELARKVLGPHAYLRMRKGLFEMSSLLRHH